MLISEVQFPVFNIRHVDRVFREDGILYAEVGGYKSIIDNTNLAGATIADRRLRVTDKLYRLGIMVEDLAGLVTAKPKTKQYVDMGGNLFYYIKKISAKVKYHKVTKTVATDQGIVCYLSGSNIPRLANHVPEYIGLAHIPGGVSLLYEYSEEAKPDRRIMI